MSVKKNLSNLHNASFVKLSAEWEKQFNFLKEVKSYMSASDLATVKRLHILYKHGHILTFRDSSSLRSIYNNVVSKVG